MKTFQAGTRAFALAALALGGGAWLAASGSRAQESANVFAQSVGEQRYSISLADLMGFIQQRHMRLSLAADAKNWPLVAFEAHLLNQTLASAAVYYSNIPIDYVVAAATPIGKIEAEALAGEGAKVQDLLDQATAACNACHTAAEIAFVKIVRPASSPFANQDFSPAGK
ncbi:hypothetical protein [Methylocella sp.]|uniref:hypothetical protein n=1 Tax=Methylocella sp. TaxID=1978226 RepID=UPI0037847F5B